MPKRISSSPPRSRARETVLALLVGCALLATLIGLHRGGPSWAADATTSAGQDLQVIDGDTLQSGGDIVQLYGVDAPELGQLCWRKGEPWQCGVEAAFALQKLVQLSGLAVTCVSWHDASETEGPNGEVIRACQLGDEEDLGMALLRNGHAWARPGSFPTTASSSAAPRRPGSASGAARRPCRGSGATASASGGKAGKPEEECNVKGMLDEAGERIYVVPTDADYDDVAVDLGKGEQLFCSDEEARHAGWRRPGETSETGDSTVR